MGLKISKIGITKDIISARGGLPLFLRYFAKIGGYQLLSSTISDKISSNNKGLQLNQFLKQIIAFLLMEPIVRSRVSIAGNRIKVILHY